MVHHSHKFIQKLVCFLLISLPTLARNHKELSLGPFVILNTEIVHTAGIRPAGQINLLGHAETCFQKFFAFTKSTPFWHIVSLVMGGSINHYTPTKPMVPTLL